MARKASEAELMGAGHPAPHRDRVGIMSIASPLIAAPLFWLARLAANYGFASHACYPAGKPLQIPLHAYAGLRTLLIAFDLAGMAVGLVALALAWRSWKISASESAGESALIEAGEGRTRFLAFWGMLVAGLFFVAIWFDFVGLSILPICG